LILTTVPFQWNLLEPSRLVCNRELALLIDKKKEEALCRLVRKAGAAIVLDKARTSTVQWKADESPVTSADLAANDVIMMGLGILDPNIPILSEESADIPYETRKKWNSYYLVDPLDGTKGFIKGRKEYTVNIALIQNGTPIFGAVFCPEREELFYGAKGLGSFYVHENAPPLQLLVRTISQTPPRIVGSLNHEASEMRAFLRRVGKHRFEQLGSSLKICQVAQRKADIYPRFGPTSEWDTAAAHAVVLYAGGDVVSITGSPLRYNQKESLLNPHFFVLGPEDREWLAWAKAAYSP